MPRGRPQRRPAAPDPDPVPPPAPRRRRMDRAQRVNDDNAPRVEDRQPEAPLPDAQPIPVHLRQDEIDRVTANVLQQIRDTGNQQQIPIYDVQGNATFSDDEFNDHVQAQVASVHTELGYQVPNKIKLKIVSDEYIDLGSLLTKSIDIEDESKQLSVKDGQIILDTKKVTTK